MDYFRELMFNVVGELSDAAAREFKEKLVDRYHRDVQAAWKAISVGVASRDLLTLKELLFSADDEKEDFKYAFDEVSRNLLIVRVTQCPLVRTLTEKGLRDLAFPLFCQADEIRVREFNPVIRMERPRLLARGDDCCLFQLRLEQP